MVYDDRFWVVGGYSSGLTCDIWTLDIPDPQGWHRVGLAGRTVNGLEVRGRDLLACTDAGISACSLDAAATSATVWNPLGLATQNVVAVSADPGSSATLYAAVLPPDAGATPLPDEPSFFRSNNDGATWQQADAGIHGLRTRALALGPSADGATTPTLFFAADGALARSRNGGRSWQTVHAQTGWIYYAVACDPKSASIVWAGGSAPASSGGAPSGATVPFLLRSHDGGDTWTNLLAGDAATSLGARVTHIALDLRTQDTVRAYCQGCVWQTADGGATRTVRPTALNLTWAETADPADPNHLYGAGRLGAEDNFGFAESPDRAARWVLPAHAREGTSEILALAVDPATPKVAFAGTRGTGIVRRVVDDGATKPALRTLTLVVGPHGTVTHWPDGWTYAAGTTVTLTALGDPGSSFVRWTGDLPSSATATQDLMIVPMDRDRTIRVEFTAPPIPLYTLTASAAGTTGTVTRVPDDASYEAGTTVTLKASTDRNHRFVQWTGDVPSTATASKATMVVTMDRNRALVASFVTQVYTLTTAVAGNGTVSRVPDASRFSVGGNVTLTALPDPGWRFVRWTGDLPGTASVAQNPIVVTMDRDRALAAEFAPPPPPTYVLTTLVTGNGAVLRLPDFPAYAAGTTVTLTARPGHDWRFRRWMGEVPTGWSLENPLVLTVDTTRTLTGQFSPNASNWFMLW